MVATPGIQKSGRRLANWQGLMMRKMPACPRCDELDLYLQAGGNSMTIKCKECGWNHAIALPIELDKLGATISAAVAAAKQGAVGDG